MNNAHEITYLSALEMDSRNARKGTKLAKSNTAISVKLRNAIDAARLRVGKSDDNSLVLTGE